METLHLLLSFGLHSSKPSKRTKICLLKIYIKYYDRINQNMYDRSISFKVYYFESHLLYKWRFYRQTIFIQLNIVVSYVIIIGIWHSVTILWEILQCGLKFMWCGCLPFQAHDNYGTWSIDFENSLFTFHLSSLEAWSSFPLPTKSVRRINKKITAEYSPPLKGLVNKDDKKGCQKYVNIEFIIFKKIKSKTLRVYPDDAPKIYSTPFFVC